MPDRQSNLKPKKLNFAEKFFPARPKQLWLKAQDLAKTQIDAAQKIGLPLASNLSYIRWLKKESMLNASNKLAPKYSGKGRMWQNPFARPRPRTAASLASVWYTAYPISHITKGKESIISTFAQEELWSTFQKIGITGIHTGPLKRAGGLNGWVATPSVDGHFDRISGRIDAMFGNEAEFKRLCEMAAHHGGIVIDDIVPGHTGKGPDFRLAEMNYGDYPGIYHMVEVHPSDWHILPDIPKGQDSTNINQATEEDLKKRGYIIGKLRRVIFYEPGVKETNWSVTKVVKGVDGIKRRWVYLHYFKEGQPSINWLDPSFAGMKLVIGDAINSIGELGSRMLRLDANGFLGIEKSSEDQPAWSEGHPLSGAANQLISGMVRKVGGFTFQELNLSIDDIKTMSDDGADLSYDFINRPAYHHALVTADTEFLRLMLRSALELGVDPASLVHALQNHDDLTDELVHFWTLHKDDMYEFQDKQLKGSELRDIVRKELSDVILGNLAPYNLPFANGIACTTVTVIAAVLGIKNVESVTTQDIESIKKVHLLLTMFNTLQPGVFALSGWDLCGSWTLDRAQIPELLEDGDTRWINRGAHDLIGLNPTADKSALGMPRAVSLYGTLNEQLTDDNSFASQLKQILSMRKKYGIATSHQVDIPEVSHKSLLVMVHRLDDGKIQVTVLNFAAQNISGSVTSEHLTPGSKVTNMFNERQVIASVDDLHTFNLALEPYEGVSLLIS